MSNNIPDYKNLFKILNTNQSVNFKNSIEVKMLRRFLLKNKYDSSNLEKNLEDVLFEYSDKISSYNSRTNKIIGLSKGSTFLHELIHLASNARKNNNERGARYANNVGESLDEAITQFITRIICENDTSGIKLTSDSYVFECLFLESLYSMYYEEMVNVFKRFFKGNVDELYNSFKDNKEMILESVKYLDIYTRNYILAIDCLTMDSEQRKNFPSSKDIAHLRDDNLVLAFVSLIKNYLKVNNYSEESLEIAEEVKYDFIDTVNICYENSKETRNKMINKFNSEMEGLYGKSR